MSKVEIIGVYPVREFRGLSLVEVQVDAPYTEIDVEQFVQPEPDLLPDEWPHAHDVRYLNPEGTLMIGDTFMRPVQDHETTRLVFFIYDLDIQRPLLTPFGLVPLPKRRPMPTRLQQTVQYHP